MEVPIDPTSKSVEAIKGVEKICDICRRNDDDPLEYGDFMQKKDLRVHYFCLLLSTNLPQRGADSGGILGFLLADIRKEVKRAADRVCVYCSEKHASVMCNECEKYFHLVCGVKNNCVFEFTNRFLSYCHEHHKINHTKKHQEDTGCYICAERMGEFNPVTSITSKCCPLNVWIHRRCLKQFALTAGYYLRCLWCGSQQFREDIRYQGIFVPDRDAQWERIRAYDDFYKKHSMCDAVPCACPKGRKYSNTGKWRLHVCKSCGACGTHAACAKKSLEDGFVCRTCQKVVEVAYRTQSFNKTLNATLFMTKSQIPYITSVNRCSDSQSDDSSFEGLPLGAEPTSTQEESKKPFIIFDEQNNVVGFVEARKKNPESNSVFLRDYDLDFDSKEVHLATPDHRERGLKMLDAMIEKVVKEDDLLPKTGDQKIIELSDSDSELSASGLIEKMCGVGIRNRNVRNCNRSINNKKRKGHNKSKGELVIPSK